MTTTPVTTAATSREDAEQTVLGWTSQILGGEAQYYDAAAGLWFPLEQAVNQLVARRTARGVLGSERDTAALNDYERRLGL